MLDPKLDEIQPGWKVVGGDGREIGTVVGTSADGVRVRQEGLGSGEWTVPADAVDEVETGRVDVSMTKDELSKTGQG